MSKTCVDLIIVKEPDGFMAISGEDSGLEYLTDKAGDNLFDQFDDAIQVAIDYLQSLKRGY